MYALVLSYGRRPRLRLLSEAHRYVLGTLAAALRPLAPGVQCRGTSDLALGEYKFAGNSARCRHDHLLYHGTLLYDFPLELIDRCLAMPPRMPEYRVGRPHGGFVANLPVKAETLRQASVRRGMPASLAAIGPSSAPRSLWPRSTAGRSGTSWGARCDP